MWEFLGRIDTIFGVLGGLLFLWEKLSKIPHRNGDNPKKEETSYSSRHIPSILLRAVDKASSPISYTLIITVIMTFVVIAFSNTQEARLTYVLPIIITSFATIFAGLVSGTFIDFIANGAGTAIKGAVIVSVIVGYTAAIKESMNGSVAMLSLISGLIGGIIGLVYERSEQSRIIRPDGTWETAKSIALLRFKQRQEKYKWILEQINIESFEQEKGKAILTVSIVEKKQVGLFEEKWWPIERYGLTIDRTGDILEMRSVPLRENEKYIGPLDQYWHDELVNFPNSIKRNTLIIKEVKEPVTKVTDKGLNVQVEFIVENQGGARKVYPYVEYDVAQIKFGKYETTTIRSPSTWEVDLQPRSITPIIFETLIDHGSIVLTKEPHVVKAKLYMKPIKTSK